MTVVIAIQVLAAGLVGGMLFERRPRRREQPSAALWDLESSAIEFHPELMVRWDDEAAYAQPARCDRRTSVDRRVQVHPQAATSRPHMHIR